MAVSVTFAAHNRGQAMAKKIDSTDPSYLFYWRQSGCTSKKHLLVCEHCGQAFGAARRDAKFCGAACRVAAGRPARQTADARRAARAVALETKRSQSINRTCDVCGRPFQIDATQTAKIYCSAACRQKAHRRRRGAVWG
jgi:ferredoxin